MHFQFEQSIGAPRDVVERAFVDPEFYRALGTMPNIGVPEVLERRTEGGSGPAGAVVTIRVRYAFDGNLAAPARAVIDPAKLTWVMETVTEPVVHGARFRMLPDHYANRLDCQGSYRFLEDTPTSTRQLVEGDLVVHFPLVAGAVERAILSGMRDNLGVQADVLVQWARPAPGRRRAPRNPGGRGGTR